jgi:hypothetical protein
LKKAKKEAEKALAAAREEAAQLAETATQRRTNETT